MIAAYRRLLNKEPRLTLSLIRSSGSASIFFVLCSPAQRNFTGELRASYPYPEARLNLNLNPHASFLGEETLPVKYSFCKPAKSHHIPSRMTTTANDLLQNLYLSFLTFVLPQ